MRIRFTNKVQLSTSASHLFSSNRCQVHSHKSRTINSAFSLKMRMISECSQSVMITKQPTVHLDSSKNLRYYALQWHYQTWKVKKETSASLVAITSLMIFSLSRSKTAFKPSVDNKRTAICLCMLSLSWIWLPWNILEHSLSKMTS